MTYPTHIVFTLAMLSDFQDGIRREFDLLWAAQHSHLSQLVLNLALAGVSPAATFEFETRLAELLRELGRLAMECVCNRIEGDDPAALPSRVREDGEDFRRLGDKTPNRHVATLFGTITLRRHSYRCSRRDAGETAIFPPGGGWVWFAGRRPRWPRPPAAIWPGRGRPSDPCWIAWTLNMR